MGKLNKLFESPETVRVGLNRGSQAVVLDPDGARRRIRDFRRDDSAYAQTLPAAVRIDPAIASEFAQINENIKAMAEEYSQTIARASAYTQNVVLTVRELQFQTSGAALVMARWAPTLPTPESIDNQTGELQKCL